MGYLGFTTCAGKTKLSGGKSTYSARAKHWDTIKDKTLVEGLAAETGYSATIVGAVVEGMRNYLCKQLKDGNKVDFGAFSVGLSVRGPFPAANAPFDPAVNSIGVDIRAGKELRTAVENLVPQNMTDIDIPRIGNILSRTHQANSNYGKIMRGDECEMVGAYFADKYTGDGDGVWLENSAGAKIATARIGEHAADVVYFTFDADIPFGNYWLVIGCRDPKKSIVATGKRRVEVVPALR